MFTRGGPDGRIPLGIEDRGGRTSRVLIDGRALDKVEPGEDGQFFLSDCPEVRTTDLVELGRRFIDRSPELSTARIAIRDRHLDILNPYRTRHQQLGHRYSENFRTPGKHASGVSSRILQYLESRAVQQPRRGSGRYQLWIGELGPQPATEPGRVKTCVVSVGRLSSCGRLLVGQTRVHAPDA